MPTKNDYFAAALLFMLVGALSLFLLSYLSPVVLDLMTLVLAIFMLVIAIGGFGFYIAKDYLYLGVGLVILAFAFMSSLFLSVGTISEYWQVVDALENNPNYYIDFIRNVLLGLGPLVLGIILCLSAHFKKGKIPIGNLETLFTMTMGGFFVFWGTIYFHATFESYFLASNMLVQEKLNYLEYSLLAIYSIYCLIGILWLVSGMFFLTLSICRLYRNIKGK